MIVASEDSVDFWEGTVEKYTSFSKLPAKGSQLGLKIEAAIGHLLVTVQIWNGYLRPSIQYTPLLPSCPAFSKVLSSL